MRMRANGFIDDMPSTLGPGGYIGLDHAATMDICQHPEWQYLHGQFSSKAFLFHTQELTLWSFARPLLTGFTAWAGPRPGLLRPIFSFAHSAFAADILNAPLEQFEDVAKNAEGFRAWEAKTDSRRLLWRGQSTGTWFDRPSNWRVSHRVRLHQLGTAPIHAPPKALRTLVSSGGIHKVDEVRVREKSVPLSKLVNRYLDAQFVGKLVQCSIEDGSCERVAQEFEFGEAVDWDFQNRYKVTSMSQCDFFSR